nr:hypothetical protein [Escherichia coli]MDN1106504.1 hypothetical protein [Escherichia coli]MDN1196608.1 hypothetical protein [Escherichia coli]
KGTTKCLNLLTIDSFCRIEREVKCQQIWPVLHHFVNKTLDVPHSGSNASIICTILSLLKFTESVQKLTAVPGTGTKTGGLHNFCAG